jgi:hypothetical protein
VLVPFLWATGGNEQLRFRILPLEHFSNVKVLYTRRDAGMPVDNLIVHAGSLHGAEKVSIHGRRGKCLCEICWGGSAPVDGNILTEKWPSTKKSGSATVTPVTS